MSQASLSRIPAGKPKLTAQYDAALDLLIEGNFSEAFEAFRALVAEYPDSELADDVQFHIGVCYTLLGQHDLAVMEYYRVALDYPQSDLALEALVKAAEALTTVDFYQDAIAMFSKVLEDYPDAEPAAYAQTYIGWLYGGMGDTEKAKAELEKVATNYPDGPYVETAKESLKKLISEAVPTEKFNKCEGDEPYLYVEDMIVEKRVKIPIIMRNAKDLADMDLDWSYNASVLKIINVTTGSLNEKALFDWNEVSPGKLKIAFASAKGVTGSGSIAVMKFEVIGNTGDTSTLTGTVTTASKTDGTEISVSVNHGEFTVGTSQIKGDCDGNGELTVKDALAAIQMSVVKVAVDMCCDYNGDGKVDSSDAREILKAIGADQ